MKKFSKIWIAVVLVIACLSTVAFAAGAIIEKKAVLSQNTFVLDGEKVTFEAAYNIEGNNYIQLREIAKALNGTSSQFNVYWDSDLKAAVIETGAAYTGSKPVMPEQKDEYAIGETFITDNCDISVTNYKLSSNNGECWAEVTVDILLKSSDKSYNFGKFIALAEDDSGKIYTGFGFQGDPEVNFSQKQSYTAEYLIQNGAELVSVTVKDPITNKTAVFDLQ